jgi:catechol 2,3-dioxygenase-like lactoylglutathione lyase family enzyme
VDGHDAARGVEELVATVGVGRDVISGGVLEGAPGDVRCTAEGTVGRHVANSTSIVVSSQDRQRDPVLARFCHLRADRGQKEEPEMLDTSDLMAFVTTARPEEARAFYSDVLGLRLLSDDAYALVYDAHGTTLRVSKAREVQVAPYTVLGWKVADIAATVRALGARGVAFNRYGGLEQDDLGIWAVPGAPARVAWFKDPDGNTLSLTQISG